MWYTGAYGADGWSNILKRCVDRIVGAGEVRARQHGRLNRVQLESQSVLEKVVIWVAEILKD